MAKDMDTKYTYVGGMRHQQYLFWLQKKDTIKYI